MIGKTFSHYEILERLGSGGMGVVYRARDLNLARDVAIKVLSPDLFEDLGARQRFRREALALSKLRHTGIEIIYEFASQDDVDFLVMEYIPGQTLAESMPGNPRTEQEIVALALKIAEALHNAHRSGVIHRDLKPANVMITPEEDIKVLDFGLARVLQPSGPMETTEVVSFDQPLAGTLPYMAPEQLRGELADTRTDIYAMGILLYELITGRRPFRQQPSAVLVADIQHEPPLPPAELNPTTTPRMQAIILKCMEKDPAKRYPSFAKLRTDLLELSGKPQPLPQKPRTQRQMVTTVVAIALVAFFLVVLGIRLNDRLSGHGESVRSLAVLPLTDLSRADDQEYLADGMTEALITALGEVSDLRVISQTSVTRYKDTEKSLRDVASELNVDAIVEGSVIHDDGQVQITARLIDASTDSRLWSASYDRPLANFLELRREVARAITDEIEVELDPDEAARLDRADFVDPEVQKAYLRGRHLWKSRTVDGILRSKEYFEQALAIDPNFAPAHAGLADAYLLMSTYIETPNDENQLKAREAAVRALELDDTLAEAHNSLAASLSGYHNNNWPRAEMHFRRAIELNPSYVPARYWYAEDLIPRRLDEALKHAQIATELDPFSVVANSTYAFALMHAEQFQRAIEWAERSLEMNPTFRPAWIVIALSQAELGNYEEAVTACDAMDTTGVSPAPSIRGGIFADSGRVSEAQSILEDLIERSNTSAVDPYGVALLAAKLGDLDLAFEWLDVAYEQAHPILPRIVVHPDLPPGLVADPRYEALTRRLNLEPPEG